MAERPGDLTLLMTLGTLPRAEPGSAADAEKWFRAATAAHPWNSAAWNNLGVALAVQAKPRAAVGYFKRAIDLDRGSARAHSNLGAVLADLGNL